MSTAILDPADADLAGLASVYVAAMKADQAVICPTPHQRRHLAAARHEAARAFALALAGVGGRWSYDGPRGRVTWTLDVAGVPVLEGGMSAPGSAAAWGPPRPTAAELIAAEEAYGKATGVFGALRHSDPGLPDRTHLLSSARGRMTRAREAFAALLKRMPDRRWKGWWLVEGLPRRAEGNGAEAEERGGLRP